MNQNQADSGIPRRFNRREKCSSFLGTDFSANWFEEGTGAFFSGDTSDILWQNTNGAIAVWQEQGATLVSSNSVLNPGPAGTSRDRRLVG
jgi:hypothetical protein